MDCQDDHRRFSGTTIGIHSLIPSQNPKTRVLNPFRALNLKRLEPGQMLGGGVRLDENFLGISRVLQTRVWGLGSRVWDFSMPGLRFL